jgi:peptidoglycan glycosyltransferase
MNMNRSIRRLFILASLLFASLIATLGYWQVVQAKSLAENPHNTRKVFAQLRIERGLILGQDRSELARNRKEDDLYLRVYPSGDLAPHLIGYNDAVYGQVGLEHSQNSYLTGTADEVELFYLLDTIMGKHKRGADLRLTIQPEVQKTAVSELEKLGKRGSVVAIDVSTGAVLAMASTPSFDANELASNWQQLNADPDAPLLNRATQGLYTPGSAFKIITTAAALENGMRPDQSFRDDKGYIDIFGNRINNYRTAPFGDHTLKEAFAQSINTTFAQVGDQLGRELLIDYQKKFGLYSKPPFDLPEEEIKASGRYEEGKLASPGDPLDRVAVVWMSIGQENVQVTPLQMAMIAQSVANGGKMMRPFSVDSVSDFNGTIIHQTSPDQIGEPIRPETARQLTDMMISVVNEGTGSKAKTDQVQIAGKTGTAEVEGRGPNAWFVGFAPAKNPKVAIAVVIEDSDAGGGISGPVAKETLLAALGLAPE